MLIFQTMLYGWLVGWLISGAPTFVIWHNVIFTPEVSIKIRINLWKTDVAICPGWFAGLSLAALLT